MTEPREVEAKFDIGDDGIAVLSEVDSIGRFRVVSRNRVSQHDRYFDNAHGDLARERASFRVRRKSSGAEVTFKGSREPFLSEDESHIASRVEDEVTIDEDVADRMWNGDWNADDERLSPVRRAVALCRQARLSPTAELQNERMVVRLESNTGEELEMAVDTCNGIRLTDGRRVEFNELELEVKRADRNALIEATHALQLTLPEVVPSQRTKLERVLG